MSESNGETPQRVDLLVVGEQFAEDGSDRACVVSRALEFLLDGVFPGWTADHLQRGRAELSVERIDKLVRAGCFVVLVDQWEGETATPKINAVHRAMQDAETAKVSSMCYVLPITERGNGDRVAEHDLDSAAVAFLEWFARRMGILGEPADGGAVAAPESSNAS